MQVTDVDDLLEGRDPPDRLARVEAFVCQPFGHARRVTQGGSGIDGPRHPRNDDALFALEPEREARRSQIARSSRSRQRHTDGTWRKQLIKRLILQARTVEAA